MMSRPHAINVEEYLRQHGSITYRFSGTSMLPLLRQGRDAVTLRLLAPGETPRRGSVVLFRSAQGKAVLHRVVRVRGGLVTTRGDNCAANDAPVPFAQVIGVLTHVIRDGRTYSVDGAGFRAYSGFITATTPVRLGYMRARAAAGRLLRGRR